MHVSLKKPMHVSLKKIAVVGVLTAALAGVSATSAFASGTTTATTAAPGASTCLPAGHDDAWPLGVNGRPDLDAGVSVWHDSTGWHVRVTHNRLHDRVFSGEIVTSGSLVAVRPVRLEKNDYLKVGPGLHTIVFRFNNYGGVDGFDFATHCAPFLEFGFVSDGHVVPTSRISVGAHELHPAHDPFVIKRTA